MTLGDEIRDSLPVTSRLRPIFGLGVPKDVCHACEYACECEIGFECRACTKRHDEVRRADAEAQAREDRGSELPFTPSPRGEQ